MKKIFLLGVILAMSNVSYYAKAADGDVLVRDIDTGVFYKINLSNHKPMVCLMMKLHMSGKKTK